MRHKPDLIVPIRDRRQHRRILTLKNFAYVAVAAIMFFAGLTIQSDFRHKDKSEEYGRLFGKQAHAGTTVEQKTPDIVVTPIQDQTAADPLLVSAQAREQWLRVEPATTTINPGLTQTEPAGVVITRGKQPEASQPTLSGGIFRQ